MRIAVLALLTLTGCGTPTSRCYISSSGEVGRSYWTVIRVMDWWPDDWSGAFSTPEEASTAARNMGCDLALRSTP